MNPLRSYLRFLARTVQPDQDPARRRSAVWLRRNAALRSQLTPFELFAVELYQIIHGGNVDCQRPGDRHRQRQQAPGTRRTVTRICIIHQPGGTPIDLASLDPNDEAFASIVIGNGQILKRRHGALYDLTQAATLATLDRQRRKAARRPK